jgi:hypothetical protein
MLKILYENCMHVSAYFMQIANAMLNITGTFKGTVIIFVCWC